MAANRTTYFEKIGNWMIFKSTLKGVLEIYTKFLDKKNSPRNIQNFLSKIKEISFSYFLNFLIKRVIEIYKISLQKFRK
jgi:hypothetical protein